MTSAAIPLLATLYAMGGNVTAAASGAAGLTVYLTLTEELVGKTVVPFAGVCLAFAAMEAVDSNMRLGTLAATVKKQYTTLLAFLMTLLLAMLGRADHARRTCRHACHAGAEIRGQET